MNNIMSWAKWSIWYKQLKVVHDIDNSRSRKLKDLDVMNNSKLWMTWMTPSRELKVIDAMKNSGLSMIWMTIGRKVIVVDDMNDYGLWTEGSRSYE